MYVSKKTNNGKKGIDWVTLFLSLSVPIIFSTLFSVVGALTDRLSTLEDSHNEMRVSVNELMVNSKWYERDIENIQDEINLLRNTRNREHKGE